MSADDLAQAIGYNFTRPELFDEALTHPSALASEHRRTRRGGRASHRGYERLEFLGDRVLGLVIADLLWRRFESEPVADVCEALIAAIYLDGGFEAASEFVRRFWEPLIDEMDGPPRDPKTALQEWAQARALALPTYELVDTSGPDHALRFTVAAKVAGRDCATATASSKRIAEARAAELLLDRLAAET